tara:strand:- start:257 stop:454 length:198 start_codon:yes stop_codon:yes gene_type:complete
MLIIAAIILLFLVPCLEYKKKRVKKAKSKEIDRLLEFDGEKIGKTVHPDNPINNFNDWSEKVIRR